MIGMTSTVSRLIATRCGQVAVRTVGDGPMLFMLHGVGSSARSFRLQLEAFRHDFQVVVWDAPGYGSSETPTDSSIDTYAGAAADVIAALSRDGTAHVVGVSWGGMIATRLAINTPDVVNTLTLVASSRGHGPGTGREAQMQNRLDAVNGVGIAAFFATRLGGLFGTRPVPEAVQVEARSIATWDIREDGYIAALESMLALDHLPDMHRVAAPTLVVVGSEDDVAAPDEAKALDELIPDSELLLVDGIGHLVNQEAPELFNDALQAHIARHSR